MYTSYDVRARVLVPTGQGSPPTTAWICDETESWLSHFFSHFSGYHWDRVFWIVTHPPAPAPGTHRNRSGSKNDVDRPKGWAEIFILEPKSAKQHLGHDLAEIGRRGEGGFEPATARNREPRPRPLGHGGFFPWGIVPQGNHPLGESPPGESFPRGITPLGNHPLGNHPWGITPLGESPGSDVERRDPARSDEIRRSRGSPPDPP